MLNILTPAVLSARVGILSVGFFPSEDNKLSLGKSYRTLKVDHLIMHKLLNQIE